MATTPCANQTAIPKVKELRGVTTIIIRANGRVGNQRN